MDFLVSFIFQPIVEGILNIFFENRREKRTAKRAAAGRSLGRARQIKADQA